MTMLRWVALLLLACLSRLSAIHVVNGRVGVRGHRLPDAGLLRQLKKKGTGDPGKKKGAAAKGKTHKTMKKTRSAHKTAKKGVNKRSGAIPALTYNQMDFFFLKTHVIIPPPNNATAANDIGTVYIFQGPLFFANASEIPGANVTGVCTKTQNQEQIEELVLMGGGHCRFTYILTSDESGFPLKMINTAGEMFDLAGGTLSITGGTDAFATSSGHAIVQPLYQDQNLTDVFLGATGYFVQAKIL